MYSKYINNIRLREEQREPVVGGVSLPMFLNISSETIGGGKSIPEGIRKISHLSIPVGLVVTDHITKSQYIMQPKAKLTYGEQDDIQMLDEQLFNKLYHNTAYQTKSKSNTKKRQTRRKRRL